MDQLPDFLIIGAARCGTSSLFLNLLKHPRIVGPTLPQSRFSNDKECHFFDKKFNDPRYGIKWYQNRFQSNKKNPVFCEATPNYLYDSKVPGLVKAHLPKAKFIAMLRNPVDRAWSHYYHWHKKTGWHISVLLDGDHPVLKKGIYWEQLERWFSKFYRNQILIIKSEDFYKNERKIINQCFKFVGLSGRSVEKKVIDYWDPKREYLKSPTAYQKPPERIVSWLRNFYAPHNEKLEKLLKRKFNWD